MLRSATLFRGFQMPRTDAGSRSTSGSRRPRRTSWVSSAASHPSTVAASSRLRSTSTTTGHRSRTGKLPGAAYRHDAVVQWKPAGAASSPSSDPWQRGHTSSGVTLLTAAMTIASPWPCDVVERLSPYTGRPAPGCGSGKVGAGRR
jgi:hypothetical protein